MIFQCLFCCDFFSVIFFGAVCFFFCAPSKGDLIAEITGRFCSSTVSCSSTVQFVVLVLLSEYSCTRLVIYSTVAKFPTPGVLNPWPVRLVFVTRRFFPKF